MTHTVNQPPASRVNKHLVSPSDTLSVSAALPCLELLTVIKTKSITMASCLSSRHCSCPGAAPQEALTAASRDLRTISGCRLIRGSRSSLPDSFPAEKRDQKRETRKETSGKQHHGKHPVNVAGESRLQMQTAQGNNDASCTPQAGGRRRHFRCCCCRGACSPLYCQTLLSNHHGLMAPGCDPASPKHHGLMTS